MSLAKPVVVVGDGWAALGAVGFLATEKRDVCWVTGTGARMLPSLPTAEGSETSSGLTAWIELARALGIECEEPQSGSYLREFRNKAFREPLWVKAPTPPLRKESRGVCLWAPERNFAPLFEARLSGLTLAELEEAIRERLALLPNIRRVVDVPVTGVKVTEGSHSSHPRVQAVILGSGEEIECEEVIYADRWSDLAGMSGLPKPLTFMRKRESLGILQASFTHSTPMGVGLQEGFFAPLHKEAGEEFERHVWGYFSSDGRSSVWTICLSPEEVEDNHEIAKRLRRLKSAVDKMFNGFLANVVEEQVRFEESIIFSEGEIPVEPISLNKLSGIRFVTDGYGPSAAMQQVVAFRHGDVPVSVSNHQTLDSSY